MKTEREIYLKPLTLREQVAMEQGICSASVYEKESTINVKGHEVGATYEFSVDGTGTANGDEFEIEWN